MNFAAQALPADVFRRVVRQPDEIQLHFSRESADGLYVRFLDVVSAVVGREGAVVQRLTEERGDGAMSVYRLRAESDVHSTVGARSWTWHPVSPEDVFGFELSAEEQFAVESAMRAVISRDVDAVRAVLVPEFQASVDSFWIEADEYDDAAPLELTMPPGPVSDWSVSGIRQDDGRVSLEADVWASGNRTDLSLVFWLVPRGAGSVAVEVQSMHVL